jgi:hypothetical protein
MERTGVNGIKVPCKSKPNSKVTDDLLVPLSFQDCWTDPWPELDPGPVMLWPTHFKKSHRAIEKMCFSYLFMGWSVLPCLFNQEQVGHIHHWKFIIVPCLISNILKFQGNHQFHKPKWCADLESNSEILVLCHFWIFQKKVCASPGGF